MEVIVIQDNGEDEPQPTNPLEVVVSTDPGKQHCAVVRYVAGQDRFTHAELFNLWCTCDATAQGRGALMASFQSANHPAPPPPSKRKRKGPSPASVFTYPNQLLSRFQTHPALFEGLTLMAVERQNAQDTGNMVIQTVFQTHFADTAALQVPKQVKVFWNNQAQAVGKPLCFRFGSHSINKTDAKRTGKRILTPSEQALFRAAAERNRAHSIVCPVMIEKRRTQKRKRKAPAIPPLKTDDLVDAALQAIYAAENHENVVPRRARARLMRPVIVPIVRQRQATKKRKKKKKKK